jgi:hypothetical protein
MVSIARSIWFDLPMGRQQVDTNPLSILTAVQHETSRDRFSMVAALRRLEEQ